MFVWSKNHKEGYQQGMLYLLSIIVFVVYQSNLSDFYTDSYMIFDRVMTLQLSKFFSTKSGYLDKKCAKTVDYLKLADIDLYLVLNKHNIDAKIFLLYFSCRKWMRCMFTKEFYLEEVLNIWDAIFQEFSSKGFYMIEFFALAMMIWARNSGILHSVFGDSEEILPKICSYNFKGEFKMIKSLAFQCKGYILENQYEKRLILPEILIV